GINPGGRSRVLSAGPLWPGLLRPVGAAGSAPGTDAAPLPPALAPDRGLALALPLRARLLVEAALPELGVEAGALHLPLEAAQRPLETLVVLYRYFQKATLLESGVESFSS